MNAPSSAEAVLERIWKQVLDRVESVGPQDNFFALGGNSVKLAKMVSLARKAGFHIGLNQAWRDPTIAGIARMDTADTAPSGGEDLLREAVFGGRGPGRRAHIILTSGEDLPIVSTLAADPELRDTGLHVLTPVWNASRPYVRPDRLAREFATHMAQDPPEGGFLIVGHCAAGPLAARAAAHLQRLGHPVNWLVLLDSEVPGPKLRDMPLIDDMPHRPIPERLSRLRAELARIRELRTSGPLSPTDTVQAAWAAARGEPVELLSWLLGVDAAVLSPATRTEALHNFMAWLSLVVALEEPVQSRMDDHTRVLLLVSGEHTEEGLASYRDSWRRSVGGSVELWRTASAHRELLHDQRLAGLLAGRPTVRSALG